MPTPDASRRAFLTTGLGAATLHAAISSPARPGLAPESPKDNGLRYGVLGKTGLKTTRLIYGSCTGNDASVITRAIDMGLNFVDTSRDYQDGNNERLVAAGIKGLRHKIILSSKTIDVNLPGQPAAPLETVADAMKELETSLRELQTDHLDIWYLHHKNQPEHITDALLEAGALAKKQGKIRFTGVSTHRIAVTADRIISCGAVDVVMATYNFTMDGSVAPAIARVRKAGIGVVAFKCAAGGPRGSVRQMKQPGAMAASYRWALRDPNVDAVESNIEDVDQLEENFICMATPYSPADEKVLAARLEQIGPYQCRMCGRCEGTCRQGLPVEDILRYVMYADGYGQFGMGRSKFLSLPEPLRELRCGDCAECTVRCVNGIRVAEQVARAQELFA